MKRQTATLITCSLIFIYGSKWHIILLFTPGPCTEVDSKHRGIKWTVLRKGKSNDKQAIIYFKGILSKYYFAKVDIKLNTVDMLRVQAMLTV